MRETIGNQQHPLPHEKFTRWFSLQQRNTKIGCVCFSLIGLLALCGICGFIGNTANANHGSTTTLSATDTPLPPTSTPTTDVLSIQPTDTPTNAPTNTPIPPPTPTPKSTPKPTPRPTPTQVILHPTPTPKPHCAGINNNPWCYDFNAGNLIDPPPSGFCNYFNCISSFYGSDDPGDGYIIECQDTTYSQSGGERGACSYHGGELRPLYSH